MTSTATAPTTHEAVPSWTVTADMLDAWGFTVERTDKVVGCRMVMVAGLPFEKARHLASLAGFCFTATEPTTSPRRHELAARERAASFGRMDPEMVAWAAECKARQAAALLAA